MAFTPYIEGVNVAASYSINTTTNPEYPRPPHVPGTHIIANDGSTWVFCQVGTTGSAIAAADIVLITQDNTWVATGITGAGARSLLGAPVGVAGAAAAVSTTSTVNYIWVQRSGYAANVNVATSATANTALHTNATNSGRLNSAADTGVGTAITNIVANATAAANKANCFLSFPMVGSND